MSNLRSLITLFLDSKEADQASPAYRRNLAFHLRSLAEYFGKRPVEGLVPLDLARWHAQLRRADGGRYSAASLSGAVAAAKLFFGWLAEQGVIESNVASRLKRRHYGTNPDRIARESDVDTVRQSLELHAQRRDFTPLDVRDALVVSLSLDSGARRGELWNLRLDAFERSLMRPLSTRSGNIYRVSSAGKTGPVTLRFGERSAYLGRIWLKVRPPTSTPALLVSLRDGRKLSITSITKAFAHVCDACGVERFYSHAVRHHNVTRLMRSGADATVASRYANHSSVNVTLGIYRHLEDEEVDELAAEVLTGGPSLADALFSPLEREK